MTGLLTVAAVIVVLSLMTSAAGTLGRVAPADPSRRGPWGMITRTSQRTRPLNPQERRWQTALIAGKDADIRWRDLVAEIETLQRLNSISPDEPAPESYSARWIDRTVSELEATIEAKTIDSENNTNKEPT